MMADQQACAGPLRSITVATRAWADTRRCFEQGYGLHCLGPVDVPSATRAARCELWGITPEFDYQEYHFARAGVADAAQLRVLVPARPEPGWRGSGEPGVLGPYTIGFPNNGQDAVHARLLSLGLEARNPVERTHFQHPDGRSWDIFESVVLTPDHVATVGIQRGSDQPPISPLDAAGLGGPAYSMWVVDDVEQVAAFLRDGLGYEVRQRRRQRAAGRRGAMNTPDGTEFELAQLGPRAGQHGFFILLQFTNLPVRRPARPPRLPASGLVMYSLPVDDLDAVLRRAAAAGAEHVAGPLQVTDADARAARVATLRAPGGILLELSGPIEGPSVSRMGR